MGSREFKESIERKEYYLEAFEKAMGHGRIVVGYETDEEVRPLKSAVNWRTILRDDFTFRRIEGIDGLVLTNFSVRRPSFHGRYRFNPCIAHKELWRERLLGIWSKTKII